MLESGEHRDKGLKETPLKGPLGLNRGLQRYIRVILGY